MLETTYNPILGEEAYSNNVFSVIPFPRPQCAIVMTASHINSVPLVITNQEVPSKSRIRHGKYDRQTTVDLQTHIISFESELLSADHVSNFHLSLSMSAHVEDPWQVCEAHVTDVTAFVKSNLLPKLKDRACLHQATELRELREDICALLGAALYEAGICLKDFSVQVEADQAYTKHLEDLRSLQYKEEYEQIRSTKAKSISAFYDTPKAQAFAEFASSEISIQEAINRIKADSAGDFDEKLRRTRELLALVQEAQDKGLGSPAALASSAEQLLAGLASGPLARQNSDSSALESGPSGQGLFAPPEDDEGA